MYVDPRVSSRFTQLAAGEGGVSSWGDRLLGLGGIVLSTIRHQSIENAPLLVFAVVGAVLFLFMVRTYSCPTYQLQADVQQRTAFELAQQREPRVLSI